MIAAHTPLASSHIGGVEVSLDVPVSTAVPVSTEELLSVRPPSDAPVSVGVAPSEQTGAPAQSESLQSKSPSPSLSAPSEHSPGFLPSTAVGPRRASLHPTQRTTRARATCTRRSMAKG